MSRSITPAVNAELRRIESVQAGTAPASLPEFAREGIAMNVTLLDRARTATSPLLRLYRLRDASVSVGALAYLAAKHSAIADQEALRILWESEGKAMSIASPRTGGALVERALAQAARNRAMKLYRASLPYGKASGVVSGVYYLGEARANLDYAKFVESLPVDPLVNERAPSPEAIAKALRSLENEIVAGFERDRTSSDVILPSALLKEARELEDAGLHDAATLTLMEARLVVSRVAKAPAPAGAPVPAIPASAGSASLTALFAGIARQRGPDFARLVVGDVLPFHATLYEPVTAVALKNATVTVTLVRWPYT